MQAYERRSGEQLVTTVSAHSPPSRRLICANPALQMTSAAVNETRDGGATRKTVRSALAQGDALRQLQETTASCRTRYHSKGEPELDSTGARAGGLVQAAPYAEQSSLGAEDQFSTAAAQNWPVAEETSSTTCQAGDSYRDGGVGEERE
jgi:hypothetical protein